MSSWFCDKSDMPAPLPLLLLLLLLLQQQQAAPLPLQAAPRAAEQARALAPAHPDQHLPPEQQACTP
jgi:hypothetical protein